MDIRKSQEYKALRKVLKKDVLEKLTGVIDDMEMVVSSHTLNLTPTKPRINEHIIHDMYELDHNGDIRKLHKDISWDSEEDEEESWKYFVAYVEKVGVARFNKRRFRPYEKTSNLNLCQRRRKDRKTIKSNGKYKLGRNKNVIK